MIYVLTDIDDTLMQTIKKMPYDQPRHTGAVDADGNDLSYMTGGQKALCELWMKNATVIPVTGRSSWAMDRVQLAFESFKIVSHGAIVLDERNRPSRAWIDSISEEIAFASTFMDDCYDAISFAIEHEGLAVNLRKLVDHEIPVYLSLKGLRGSESCESDLDRIQEILEEKLNINNFGRALPNWRIHRNGRNMALLPPYACKKRSSLWLLDHLGAEPSVDLVMTAGDSTSDLPFMQVGHMMVVPANSQISDKHLFN